MDEEFHLSIKNNPRKKGDVRDLFKNLSELEKNALELEKKKVEQRLALTRKSHNLDETGTILDERPESANRQVDPFNNKVQFRNLAKYNSVPITSNEKNSHEERVLSIYNQLDKIDENFGNYLEDDEDEYEARKRKNEERLKEIEASTTLPNRKSIIDKLPLNKKASVISTNQQIKIPRDMGGLYESDLPPAVKERYIEEQRRQLEKTRGLNGIKTRLKNLFIVDDGLDYAYNRGAPVMRRGKKIHQVRYDESKIGRKNKENHYQDYYTRVDQLRRLEQVSKYQSGQVAIVDDSLDVNIKPVDRTTGRIITEKEKLEQEQTVKSKKPNRLTSMFNKLKN